MREIKFRAWDNFFKQMYYFDFENNIEVRSGHLWIVHEEGAISSKSPSIKIMQYTGLKDKNGIEIYEGDIVSWNNKIGYIGFLKQEMGYCIILKDTDFRLGHRNIGSGYDFNADIEVIGNIYENPELI